MEVAVIGLHKRFCDEGFFEKVHLLIQNSQFLSDDTVLLVTCNRIEIYLATPFLSERHPEILAKLKEPFIEDTEKRFYTFMGYDVLRHLSKVTAGLDSVICGESDIQHQVKKAYETQGKYLNKDGHFLFQKALHISKKLRDIFDIKPVKTLQDEVALVCEQRLKPKAKMAFLGNSFLNQKIFQKLKHLDLEFTIFSSAKPTEDSLFFETPFKSYQELETSGPFDGVIAASKERKLSRKLQVSTSSFVIDLSVPKMLKKQGAEYFDLTHFEKKLSKMALKQIQDKLDALEYIQNNVQRLVASRLEKLENFAS